MKIRLCAICLFIACLFLFACGDDAVEENDEPNDTSNQTSNDSNDGEEDNGGEGDNDGEDDNGGGDDNGEGDDNGGGDENNGEEGAQFCQYICESASDCGTEAGWTCVDERCRWESDDTEAVCGEDEDCVPFMSGWQEPCTDQEGCELTQACIDYEGEGLCAFEDGEFVDCANMDMDTISMDLFGESGQAQVCARTEYECTDEGYCIEPCQSDADCYYAGVDTCVDGTCQCGSDAACDDVDYGDVCIDGLCGCSEDQVCIDGGFDICE